MQSSQVERNVVNRFIQNAENTMSTEISNSIGMVILKLATNYFKNDTTPETLFLQCRQQLEQIMQGKNTIGIKDDIIDESMRNSIIYILKKTNEVINDLDKVTLFQYDHSLNEYKELTYVFPLKQVLTLVWIALNDDKQFLHHYEGTDHARLIQAQKDKPLRLLSFFRCLDGIMHEPRCHQGVRHALVFLLNHSYKDVEIIEDTHAEIFSYLKENITKKFFDTYWKASESKMKRELLTLLFQWMNDGNANMMLEKIDHNQQILLDLQLLFMQHGLNPKEIKLQQITNTALNSLNFSCDPKMYPTFARINILLTACDHLDKLERNKALLIIQNWIQTDCDPDNEMDQRKIDSFYFILEAFDALEKYKIIISAAGKMNAEIQSLKEMCDHYFKDCRSQNNLPLITSECITTCELLAEVITQCKKDKMSTQIENFFAQWFIHDPIYNITPELKNLYAFLLDEVVQSKIILTESEINMFMDLSITNGERELSPYFINRIFLHAILKKPTEWSDSFTDLFKIVFEFVQQNFNQNNNLISRNLKRDSYPEPLINQLNYYLKQKKQQDNNERPSNMSLLLPQHITDFYEWRRVIRLLDDKKYVPVYLKYFPIINTILYKHILNVSFSIMGSKNWEDVLDSIPHAHRLNFIIKNIELIYKCTSNDFSNILLSCPELERVKIINKLNFEKLNKMIVSRLDLYYLLNPIPKSDRANILYKFGITWLRKIMLKNLNQNSAYELSTYILVLLPESDRACFLVTLGHDCMHKIIKDQTSLCNLLRPHPEFKPLELQLIFGTKWLQKIYMFKAEIGEVLDRIRLPYRDDFLLSCVGLKNMHIFFKNEQSLAEFLKRHQLNSDQCENVLAEFNKYRQETPFLIKDPQLLNTSKNGLFVSLDFAEFESDRLLTSRTRPF